MLIHSITSMLSFAARGCACGCVGLAIAFTPGCGSTQERATIEATSCACGMTACTGKDCAEDTKTCGDNCSKDCCAGHSGSLAPAASGTVLTEFTTEPISGDRATLYVGGLGCPMCATNIDLVLNEMDAVQAGKVNLELGTVEVAFPGAPKPSAKQLAGVVSDAGFTLDRIVVR